MTWLKALDHVPAPKPVKPSTTRSRAHCGTRKIKIDGVEYKSMKEAMKKLNLKSYNQVYRLIGEKWRYGHFA